LAGDDPVPAVQDKLVKLYEEHGIHPAEVAHDAVTDPTVAQSMLSSVGDDLPKRYVRSEAETKILEKVSVAEKDPKSKISLDKLYTQAVDDLHPLKGVDEDAYQLARLTRGQFAKAQHFLEHGPFDFRTYETNGKPLKEILAPVRDDLDGVRAYLSAKRAIEIEGSGRKSGMDLAAAEKVVADGAEKYAGIAEEISAYQDQLVTYLKDAGVVSDKAFEAMREANKNYVPFFRIMGAAEHGKGRAGKSFGPGSPIKRLEGSERDIVDPLESIIKNTYLYISVAERNAVGIRLVETLKEAGNEVVTTKLPAKDAELSAFLAEHGIKSGDDLTAFVKGFSDDGETISAYRNGVKETVKVDDPELVRAFRGLDTQNLDILTRILAVPAKTLRAGAVLTPDFIARNLLRDFVGAFINSKSGLFTPIDTAKGFRSVITKDADFQNWLKSGGANATMVSLDRRYMQESLSKLTGETGLADRAWNVVKSPYQGLRMLSELAENATRLGEFKKVARGSVAKDDIQRAGFASREVTLDFARIGASMRAYNAITAFANAQIQGADRLVRAFKDHPARTSARVAGGITLPSMLLWWANHDDPRYKELPAWQRDLFWIVMTENHIFRIPKPFEAGVIFGSGVERILDKTIGQNPEAFAHFGKSMMDVLSPNFIPTGAAPMIDQFANRSTFTDRTLIPSSMEKLLPEYQYVPYTTETAKALGGLIAAFPGVREASIDDGAGVVGAAARAATTPILMENYLRAWTGGLGMYLLQIADTGLRKAGVVPDPEKPEDTLADIPFVRAFAVRYPSAGAQSIQDFYDAHARSKKFYDTYITKVKEGDIDAANAIAVAGGPGTFVRLDGMAKVLSESAHLVRMIYNNPGIKPAEKRQQIDQQYYVMITLARGGKDMIRQIERATAAQR
jgi:hypothetical protein